MPTNRRRRNIGRKTDLTYTDEVRKVLESGCDFFGACAPDERLSGHRVTDEEMEIRAAFWEAHGDEITAEWVVTNPMTRCWAWWQFTAPEPCRVISGVEDRESGFPAWNFMPKEGFEAWHKNEWPAIFEQLWAEHLKGNSQREYYYGKPNPSRLECEYEDQYDYLQRLGLALPGEVERFEQLNSGNAADQDQQ